MSPKKKKVTVIDLDLVTKSLNYTEKRIFILKMKLNGFEIVIKSNHNFIITLGIK
jgi:hypothetical protein